MREILLSRGHTARGLAEATVRRVYAKAYGARVRGFPALMAAVLDDGGAVQAAAGLRSARCGLFSECYLEKPAEACIGGALGVPVDRGGILEVTTLAAAQAGQGLALVRFVIDHGLRRGMRWGLCTVTAPLRRALALAGLRVRPLAPARAACVPDPAAWGRYYQRDPWVCAISPPGVGARAARGGRPDRSARSAGVAGVA